MQKKLKEIQQSALAALDAVQDEAALEAWRVTHLGRSSALMGVFGGLGGLSKEERPLVGQAANEVKKDLEAAFGQATAQAAHDRGPRGRSTDVGNGFGHRGAA